MISEDRVKPLVLHLSNSVSQFILIIMEAAIEEDDVNNEVLMFYYIVLVYPTVSLLSAN